MGLNPATAAMYYGGLRAAATGNLQEGIMAGLSAYGMGKAFSLMVLAPPGSNWLTTPIETRTIGPGSGGVQSGVVDAATVLAQGV
jgi:hypothetical protein